MKINFIDLQTQYLSIKEEIDNAIQKVLMSSAFTAGSFVDTFEKNYASLNQAKYCIGVNNGTSALHVSLMALNIGYGDEVIVPANTFFATAEAVSLTGAKPVFVDCEPDFYNINPELIEAAVSEKTKAIIAVHLYGQSAQIEKIKEIADKNRLYLVEDCAQAHFATYKGMTVGNFGICGCFSFYPGKNLGTYGEAGAVITNDENLYKKIKTLKDHGSEKKYYHDYIGHNYRMEGFQGAILDVKLKHISSWTESRRNNADLYRKYLTCINEIELPKEMSDCKHVYHLFVIKAPKRDELQNFLEKHSIATGIHYPVPVHLQKAYEFLGYREGDFPIAEKYSKEILSLPMFPELQEKEIAYIAEKIKEFYK